MTPAVRSTDSVAKDRSFDASIPNSDNESKSDIALSVDAMSDKLEYAVHRSGLTPRLKILMAALRRATDIGDIKFNKPNLKRFLSGGPLLIFTPSNSGPAYALPTPMPSFSGKPRPRR